MPVPPLELLELLLEEEAPELLLDEDEAPELLLEEELPEPLPEDDDPPELPELLLEDEEDEEEELPELLPVVPLGVPLLASLLLPPPQAASTQASAIAVTVPRWNDIMYLLPGDNFVQFAEGNAQRAMRRGQQASATSIPWGSCPAPHPNGRTAPTHRRVRTAGTRDRYARARDRMGRSTPLRMGPDHMAGHARKGPAAAARDAAQQAK